MYLLGRLQSCASRINICPNSKAKPHAILNERSIGERRTSSESSCFGYPGRSHRLQPISVAWTAIVMLRWTFFSQAFSETMLRCTLKTQKSD